MIDIKVKVVPHKIIINPNLYRKAKLTHKQKVITEAIDEKKISLSPQKPKQFFRKSTIDVSNYKIKRDRLSFQQFLKNKSKIDDSFEWVSVGKPRQFFLSLSRKKKDELNTEYENQEREKKRKNTIRSKTQSANEIRGSNLDRKKKVFFRKTRNTQFQREEKEAEERRKSTILHHSNNSRIRVDFDPEYRPWTGMEKDDNSDLGSQQF